MQRSLDQASHFLATVILIVVKALISYNTQGACLFLCLCYLYIKNNADERMTAYFLMPVS